MFFGRKFECLSGEGLSIAGPDHLVNLTKRTLSNPFTLVVDEPLAEGLGFTGRSSRCLAVQAKSLDGRNSFLALVDECLQIVDILRVCCGVVGRFNLDNKATSMDRDVAESVPTARLVCQNPSLLFPYLLLVLVLVTNCGPVRRMIVVQPDAKIIVQGDVVLPPTDSFRPSVSQEDMRRTRIRARSYPGPEILQ